MKPIEPMSVLLSLGTLLAAALAAVLIPAVRAAMLQPAETLRRD
jgi:ABC-type lipoprotein release transport system permease subunit